MSGKWISYGVGFLLAFTGSATWASQARGPRPGQQSGVPAIGDCARARGGETPTPICVGNFRYELADGESYVLPGWIARMKSGQVMFEVDLNQVTALATGSRKSWPLYRVVENSYADQWVVARSGKKVSLPVVARSRIIQDDATGELRPEIFLEISSENTPRH